MTDRFTIQPGRAANEAEVVRSLRATGRYSSGVPRGSQAARAASPGDLFADYAAAKDLGREKEFLKSLSPDQFHTLAASLERSMK